MRRNHTGNACISKTLWLRPLAAAKCNTKTVLVPRVWSLFIQMLHNCFILYLFQGIRKLFSVLLQQTLHKIWAISTGHSCRNIHDYQERDTYKATGNVFNAFFIAFLHQKWVFSLITDHFCYVTVAGSHRLALLAVSHGPLSGIGLCAARCPALSIPNPCCLSGDAPLTLGPGFGLDNPGLRGRIRR